MSWLQGLGLSQDAELSVLTLGKSWQTETVITPTAEWLEAFVSVT